MVNRIDIAMMPAEAVTMPTADAYVVIDAIRATTVIAVLFERGLGQLRVVSDLSAARLAAKSSGSLLFGEEHGLRPEGFDHGNSPVEAGQVQLAGRDAVHFTTNGTIALCTVAPLGRTFAGSLANLSAIVAVVRDFERVTMVCAGNARGRQFSLEDFAVAAAFASELRKDFPDAKLGDAALLGLQGPDPAQLIAVSEHADVVRGLGLAKDIEFVLQRESAPSVPFVTSFGKGWAILENKPA